MLILGDHSNPVKPGSSSLQFSTNPKEIFRKQYAALFDLMIPDNIAAIAHEMFAKGLIAHQTLQDCMTDTRKPADRAYSLLNALRVTIDQPGMLKKLIEVLKNNEAFKSIAEEMECDKPGSSSQQCSTDPKEIFRKQYSALFDLMIPDNIAAIANKLYSEGLIAHQTLQDCMNDARKPADRAHSLLNALHVTIDQPGVLKKLIEVLKNNQAFRSIAEEMECDI